MSVAGDCRLMLSHATSTVEIEKYCGQYQIMNDVDCDIQNVIDEIGIDENSSEYSWLSEQELYMMSEEHGKDELTTQTFIRKQQAIDQTIEDYSHVLHELNDRESQTRRKHLRSLASLHYGKALKLFSPNDNPLEYLRLLIEEVALADFELQTCN
ncbi:unnamed protein product, partial [Rotaria sp. Silwood1]